MNARKMTMSRSWLWLISLLFVSLPLIAQQTSTPDYAITNLSAQVAADNDNILVSFTVTNRGDASPSTAIATLTLNTNTSQVLYTETIRPLGTNQSRFVQIDAIPLADFPSNSAQELTASIRFVNNDILDGNAADNTQTILFTQDTAPFITFTDEALIVAGQSYERGQVALWLGIGLVVFLIVWLLVLLLRLIFRRPPRFGTWQPPYGMIPFDQSTIEGRRQAWQQFAQHSLLLAPPTPGNLVAIKLLLGARGGPLQNWQVTALRLSQYDQYGRIARSEYIAQRKWVRRLNRVIVRSPKLTQEALYSKLQPITRGLVQQFRKRIIKKHTMLPIAFDMRFQGEHGDVRILFELYQCQNNLWYRLDQWEPQMGVMGPMRQKLTENFTYTIHGSNPNEKPRDFYRRLQDDLVWLLLETLRTQDASMPDHTPPPRQVYDIPDTLADVVPVTDAAAQTP